MSHATGKWCLDCEAINLWSAVRCARCGHSFDDNEHAPPPEEAKEPGRQIEFCLTGPDNSNSHNHEAVRAEIVALKQAVGN